MRKILFAMISCFVALCSHAAQMANLDYIHKLIQQKWDITVPIKADNPMLAANMKYLLTAIDVANEIINGEPTTDYGNGEFATTQAVDTIATNQAVETLIKKEQKHEFTLTTTYDTDSFSFLISAAGEFVVDWGDGTVETITKPDTTKTTYSHNYSTAGAYTIGLSGQATAYNTDTSTAAISFTDFVDWEFDSAWQIASINGSLGAIFGTLSSDTNNQPRFYHTFSGAYDMEGTIPENLFAGISGAPASNMFYSTFEGCSKLTSIPAGLFAGISGAPASEMFSSTFSGCSGLTGAIPDGLFAGISGAPAYAMFDSTFNGCSRLTSIPAGLFGNLSGTPAENMFSYTFYGCSGLTGAIPAGLFGNLSGAPAWGMFRSTFEGCSRLTSIPENLFGNISGPAEDEMFIQTFRNCTSLTGPSARINGQYLYEIWPNNTWFAIDYMYSNATGLSDYLYIPVLWGGLGATTNEYPSAPSDAVYDFYLTTTSDTDVFAIQISAAGEFYIDWGDGKSEWITKSDTTNMTFGHKYASKRIYNIRLGGQATAYNTDISTAAISFKDTTSKIASIDGSLGAIFGTLSSDTNKQPRFYYTFSGASNMKGAIPENLFAGISGAPAENMFDSTFNGCSRLTGAIPSGLFAGISGAPAYGMFDSTFENCSGLTSIPDGLFAGISGAPAEYMFDNTFAYCRGLTSIPSGLFAGISGAPADRMFYGTFEGCSGLTGAIPAGLFGNLTGAPAEYMFDSTFDGCSGLTGAIPAGLFGNLSGAPAWGMFRSTFEGCSRLTGEIPENLFGNISGPAKNIMFYGTFYNCTSLTGPSARINGQYLYEIWPNATTSQVNDMYYNATKLSDYSSIPSAWK